jgi:hypothetical protein
MPMYKKIIAPYTQKVLQLSINACTNTLGMLMALEFIESKYWITVFKIVLGKMQE